MTKIANDYTPEMRERAVGLVLNGEGQHEGHQAAIPADPKFATPVGSVGDS